MYLVNYLNLQTALQLFIAVGRFRTGQGLIGVQNHANHVFRIAGGEKFTHNLPFLTISIYVNGLRLVLLEDYTISESAGPGTGYDTITLSQAPYSDDHITADYVVS
jgi:hypothetical protein